MKKIILFVLFFVLSTSTAQALPKHDMHDKAFAEMEQKYGVSVSFAKAVASRLVQMADGFIVSMRGIKNQRL